MVQHSATLFGMSDAREALLDRAMAHVAAAGMSDASLRELAAGIGTSHRMLLYHFGSRDGLVAAIVERMEADQRAVLAALAAEATDAADLVRRQWDQLTDPSVRPFLRLFFEVLALAVHGRPGTERFVDTLTAPWLDLGAALAERLGEPVTAADLRLGVAVVRGLLVDVAATGDVDGPREALERFLDGWVGAARRP
jgi:AcrR family transcriptional regulator